MQRYIASRLLLMIPTIIVLTIVTFGLLRIMPGDFVVAQMSEARGSDAAQAEVYRKQLGLDQPAVTQYFRWMGGIATGDLGTSFWQNKPVTTVIRRALPISMELGSIAIVIGLMIAIPIGVVSAIYQDGPLDYLTRSVSILGISVPNFFLGIMFIIYGANWFGWFPPQGRHDLFTDPWANLQQVIPGAIVLGAAQSGQIMRILRTTMLETLREDYIRTARAKGLTEMKVVFRHAFRNALIPVVTLLGFQIATIVGGSVVVESVFGINGIGRTYIDAVTQRDYPLVQGIALLLVMVTLVTNLLVDLSYSWLDPRIRYS